jgi:hypothetical protein
MREIRGFRGAEVLRRSDGGVVAFVTITRFDSGDDIRAFAGVDYELPVLELQALRPCCRSTTHGHSTSRPLRAAPDFRGASRARARRPPRHVMAFSPRRGAERMSRYERRPQSWLAGREGSMRSRSLRLRPPSPVLMALVGSVDRDRGRGEGRQFSPCAPSGARSGVNARRWALSFAVGPPGSGRSCPGSARGERSGRGRRAAPRARGACSILGGQAARTGRSNACCRWAPSSSSYRPHRRWPRQRRAARASPRHGESDARAAGWLGNHARAGGSPADGDATSGRAYRSPGVLRHRPAGGSSPPGGRRNPPAGRFRRALAPVRGGRAERRRVPRAARGSGKRPAGRRDPG